VGSLAIVEVMNAAILFDQDVIQELSRQLHRLVTRGRNRLLLALGGIELMSCAVLGTLAALSRELHRQNGRLGLYGLTPRLRDMIRICHLEGVLDIYVDEADALQRSAEE
jgi:anti-anti-sigma factor